MTEPTNITPTAANDRNATLEADFEKAADAGQLPERLLALKQEHAGLNSAIDGVGAEPPLDQLRMRRMKKRRLLLKDQIARIESMLIPNLDA